MRRPLFPALLLSALTLVSLSLPGVLRAQQPTSAPIGKEQLTVYAKAYTAIAQVRDQIQAEMAAPRNKTNEGQTTLQQKQRDAIAKILQDHNISQEQYQRITYAISTNAELRKTLDDIMGIKPPTPAPAAATAAGSASGARTHLDHVSTSFSGTPKGEGLLPTALAEADVVVEHAALAARNTSSLESMKTHAGHVLHAIDPAESARGPGPGYGLKKAATLIAQHIELAAKAQGASQNEITHAGHIAASARNVVERADRIAALARQIQTAATPAEAATLVARLNTVAGQLIAGEDANGDGQVGWQEREGGLKQVQQHVMLMQGMPRD
jgi:uncharacterized protein DUF4168